MNNLPTSVYELEKKNPTLPSLWEKPVDGRKEPPIAGIGSMEDALGAKPPPEMAPRRRSSINFNNDLIETVINVESSGKWDAISNVGAVGLMQVRPKYALEPGFGAKDIFTVARQMGRSVDHLPKTPDGAKRLLFDPEVNRAYGTQYLKALKDRFDGNVEHALVAYNWGPNAASRWIADGADKSKLPEETRNYLKKIQSQLTNGEAS
jgi:soluble lytic murein transglycosylase-like protein